MTTSKDLVEAQTFLRRRLVEAFLRGVPGACEAEPAHRGRMVLGSAALALLVVAAAAVASML